MTEAIECVDRIQKAIEADMHETGADAFVGFARQYAWSAWNAVSQESPAARKAHLKFYGKTNG